MSRLRTQMTLQMPLPFEEPTAIVRAIRSATDLVALVVLDPDDPHSVAWWQSTERSLRDLGEVHLMAVTPDDEPAVHLHAPADFDALLSFRGRPTLPQVLERLPAARAEQQRRQIAAQHREAEEAQMLEREDTRRFPSPFRMARNLAADAWRAARSAAGGAPVLLSAEAAHERFSVCSMCPELRDERCLQCGCYMTVKSHIATTTCPLGKWPRTGDGSVSN